MRRKCVVGSLSSIFTHSYIVSLVNSGFSVDIINTSNKINYDEYLGCDVLNLYIVKKAVSQAKLKSNSKSKSKLKSSKIFCYLYENVISAKSFLSKNKTIKSFLKGKSIDAFVFFWGTSIRKEFYNIKRIYSNSDARPSFILDVATYPIRDYATIYTPKFLLWFDKAFFNAFDVILSHSFTMDVFLKNTLNVNDKRIKRFICSFPRSAYFKGMISKPSSKVNKIIFLGALDNSSAINNISHDIMTLADCGVEVHIQESKGFFTDKQNIKTFKPFTFEQIINGELAKYCSIFDAILVSYGPMSKLREELTYPTRYALALLQNIPILIQGNRFKALDEIAKKNIHNQIIYYNSPREITDASIRSYNLIGIDSDCMENKVHELFTK